MTKSELIAAVAEKRTDLSHKDLEAIVDLIFESMTRALVKDERIELRGFGSFVVKTRDARNGRNPKSGEQVQVPKKRTPFFTTGKELKQRVQAEFAGQRTEKGH